MKKEYIAKHPSEERWFKSLNVDRNNEITEWEWTEYYESADTFSTPELLFSKLNKLGINYSIDTTDENTKNLFILAKNEECLEELTKLISYDRVNGLILQVFNVVNTEVIYYMNTLLDNDELIDEIIVK